MADDGVENSEPGEVTNSHRRSVKRNKEKVPNIDLPECKHDWCLGEILRREGFESGVCCPKPLPWGKPGRLKYLPGWEKLCREYQCIPCRYEEKKSRKAHEDVERWRKEVADAKLLWSYLSPILQFPTSLVYEDSVKPKICECAINCCMRKQSMDEYSSGQPEAPPEAVAEPLEEEESFESEEWFSPVVAETLVAEPIADEPSPPPPPPPPELTEPAPELTEPTPEPEPEQPPEAANEEQPSEEQPPEENKET